MRYALKDYRPDTDRTITLEAMGFSLPDMSDDHPNRVPFRGVLTRLDEPSTRPPNGSNGHLVMITTAVAEAALPSLIGMAVDVSPELTDHDSQKKIGIISEAEIRGRDLWVAGFLYGSDFPRETDIIKREKDKLGMSYELKKVWIDNVHSQIWVPKSLVFTGAAILYKDSAAYQNTSFAASKSSETKDMHDTISIDKEKAMKIDEILARFDELKVEIGSLISKKEPTEEKDIQAETEPEVKKDEEVKAETAECDDMKKEVEEKPEVKAEAGDTMKAAKGKKQFMKICKAMIDAMIDEDEDMDEGMEKDKSMDESKDGDDEDVRMFRKMLHRASASADTERLDKIEKSLEAAVGLITDMADTVRGLVTDRAEKKDGLATDDAKVSAAAEEKQDNPDDAHAQRKTLDASKAHQFIAKMGVEIDPNKEYTVPEIDAVLKAAGIEDTNKRLAVKLQLQEMKKLK